MLDYFLVRQNTEIFEYELRDLPAAVSSGRRPTMARIRWRDCDVRTRRGFA